MMHTWMDINPLFRIIYSPETQIQPQFYANELQRITTPYTQKPRNQSNRKKKWKARKNIWKTRYMQETICSTCGYPSEICEKYYNCNYLYDNYFNDDDDVYHYFMQDSDSDMNMNSDSDSDSDSDYDSVTRNVRYCSVCCDTISPPSNLENDYYLRERDEWREDCCSDCNDGFEYNY